MEHYYKMEQISMKLVFPNSEVYYVKSALQ
jgi:hypothetical protein